VETMSSWTRKKFWSWTWNTLFVGIWFAQRQRNDRMWWHTPVIKAI
jgi:hypothetical protein